MVGVLPIAVGKATRLVEFMQDEGKIYEGEVTLGFQQQLKMRAVRCLQRLLYWPLGCKIGR